jgi:hypothetical protein
MSLDLYQDGKHYFLREADQSWSVRHFGWEMMERTDAETQACHKRGSIHDPSTTSLEGAANCEPSSKAGNWLRELMARNLFLHGLDREQNFTKFFTKLCAAEGPDTPVRSSLLH